VASVEAGNEAEADILTFSLFNACAVNFVSPGSHRSSLIIVSAYRLQTPAKIA
jgi:hypothetical protein